MNLQAQGKGITLNVVYVGKVPKQIGSDPGRLRQILLNVVGNAIKFTDHGQVELRIKYLPEESQLEFTVTDSGIGMTLDQQKNLFQRFIQGDNSTTRKYGGTGLGLVVSQKLVRTLGGDLIIKQSKEKQGSAFVFSISNKTLSNERQQPLALSNTFLCSTGRGESDMGKEFPKNWRDKTEPSGSWHRSCSLWKVVSGSWIYGSRCLKNDVRSRNGIYGHPDRCHSTVREKRIC